MVLIKLYVYFDFVFFFNDLYNTNDNLYRYIYC